MVIDLSILLPNCASFVPAHAGTHLSFFVLGFFLLSLLVFKHRKTGMQNIDSSSLIQMLRPLRLTPDDCSCWDVFYLDSGIGCVPVLTSGSGATTCGELQILVVYFSVRSI